MWWLYLRLCSCYGFLPMSVWPESGACIQLSTGCTTCHKQLTTFKSIQGERISRPTNTEPVTRSPCSPRPTAFRYLGHSRCLQHNV
ncbi:hypothetical protein F5Y08DRAFT_46662 [Xylaria arbuscula]|nr:hypothetical protein F5Y08DRAFT_46662 [Xylaria arbuscula]